MYQDLKQLKQEEEEEATLDYTDSSDPCATSATLEGLSDTHLVC